MSHRPIQSLFLSVLLCAGVLGACTACGDEPPVMVAKRLDARTTLTVAGEPVDCELALSREEISVGLMYRRELPDDQGMLFVFTGESDRSFYMKNVPIPLDLCFLDTAGRVINIVRGEPQQREPKLRSERPARYVLELAGGWAERHGLQPGAQIQIADEVAALGLFP
ncbi:MAG: hypothetical protein DHS20C15_00340 [Planctomycetota bacterium]|nr:MAG: hypothetical protein DHS20C15_00340 [Planctomycetota bacterium]